MPLQNRMTPFGELITTPAKGTFMGNRGILHDENGDLGVKRWGHKSWVTCTLNFKEGYKRNPKERKPNEYTELFFLDEATALAAGHRPCRQCRLKDFDKFVGCFAEGNGHSLDIYIKEVDLKLHSDRTSSAREKKTYCDQIDHLPDGVFVVLNGVPDIAWLLWSGELLKWTPEGYSERREISCGEMVTVLTPKSTVNAIAAGYRPHVHHNKNCREARVKRSISSQVNTD